LKQSNLPRIIDGYKKTQGIEPVVEALENSLGF
jgi:hypothetical protein